MLHLINLVNGPRWGRFRLGGGVCGQARMGPIIVQNGITNSGPLSLRPHADPIVVDIGIRCQQHIIPVSQEYSTLWAEMKPKATLHNHSSLGECYLIMIGQGPGEALNRPIGSSPSGRGK